MACGRASRLSLGHVQVRNVLLLESRRAQLAGMRIHFIAHVMHMHTYICSPPAGGPAGTCTFNCKVRKVRLKLAMHIGAVYVLVYLYSTAGRPWRRCSSSYRY